MTALMYIARRAAVRRRRGGLDRPARARPPDPRQALRRQGHPVLRRLRPHALVAPAGETEYGVKAIPLGGYVQARRDAAARPGPGPERRSASSNTGMFAQLISDARSAEYEQVERGRRGPAVLQASRGGRSVIIMGSGVMINLVLAFLLFAVVFMGHGVTTPTTTVARCLAVRDRGDQGQREPARPRLHREPTRSRPPRRPASGPGTGSSSFNGTPVHDWDAAADARSGQRRRRGRRSSSQRDGQRRHRCAPTPPSRPRVDPTTPSGSPRSASSGVAPDQRARAPGPRLRRHHDGRRHLADRQGASASMPVKLYHVGRAALGLEQRDPNGPMSVVGAGRVAGEMASQHTGRRSPTGSSRCCCCSPGSTCSSACSTSCRCRRSTAAASPPRSTRPSAAGSPGCCDRPDPGVVDSAKLLPVDLRDGRASSW